MTREFLRSLLGDTAKDETVDKIMAENGKDAKAAADSKAKAAALEAIVADRDAQLEKLRAAGDASDKLKEQIVALQEENKTKEKEYRRELQKIHRASIDERILLEMGAINPTAAKPFLDALDPSLGDDDYIAARKRRVDELAKSEGTKFLFRDAKKVAGVAPGESSSDEAPNDGANPFAKDTYDEKAIIKMFREDKEAARAMAKKAGITIK